MILRMSLGGGERGRTLGGILVEVVLISIGVFLALLANNWHEDREHRAQGKAALRNFLGEMELNRDATQQYRAYHDTLVKEVTAFLENTKAPATEERFLKEVNFKGVQPVNFEHTAWDLAIATQALSYLKPDLAFDISKVYTDQNGIQTLENSFLAATFTPATLSTDNWKGISTAMKFYLIDVNQKEPTILSRYEKAIPEIKSALGGL
jgi:hypothetical protein